MRSEVFKCCGCLAAAYRNDQFEFVTIDELHAGIVAARHNVAVALQRDTFARIAQLRDEFGDIEVGSELLADAVDVDSNHFRLYSVR